MKITVFGTGYVGLVSGSCLSDVGYDVLCVDIDADKIARLKNGEIPIYEPGLDDVVQRGIQSGRLNFTTSKEEGVNHGEFIFIAVGTPPDEDGSADLQYVLSVASTIGQHMTDNKIVVNKSTVPIGTASKVRNIIADELDKRNEKIQFDVVSNPEFLKEGDAVNDFMRPDRIILGTDNEDIENRMRQLYAPFSRSKDKIIHMDVCSAELTKYAANAMLATKISFMNELSNIAERVGANIESIRYGIGSDPRIGPHFIYAGPGYGGSCFPKDVKALLKTAKDNNYNAELLQSVEEVNARQKELPFSKIKRYFKDDLAGKTISIWGLSFKPNTDDMRDAPSRVLLENLWQAGAKVKAYDPVAMDETTRIYGERDDLILSKSPEDAAKDTDALVVMTEWKAFWRPDFELLKSRMSGNAIFDMRNIYDQHEVESCGFEYFGIGRGQVRN